jgi:hypothetical protein
LAWQHLGGRLRVLAKSGGMAQPDQGENRT